jgi:hypothetical protein
VKNSHSWTGGEEANERWYAIGKISRRPNSLGVQSVVFTLDNKDLYGICCQPSSDQAVLSSGFIALLKTNHLASIALSQ